MKIILFYEYFSAPFPQAGEKTGKDEVYVANNQDEPFVVALPNFTPCGQQFTQVILFHCKMATV